MGVGQIWLWHSRLPNLTFVSSPICLLDVLAATVALAWFSSSIFFNISGMVIRSLYTQLGNRHDRRQKMNGKHWSADGGKNHYPSLGMKTKMVVSDFWRSFFRFYQFLRLNENENNYQKMKTKMVKKYENENESDLFIFRLFLRNIVFLRYSTIFYR